MSATAQQGARYVIASLKHTSNQDEHITLWGPDHRGYTPVLDRAGEYTLEDAAKLNDGESCMAVPVEVARALSSPTPFYKPGAQFYDHAGRVVDNTRANWTALNIGSLEEGRAKKPKFTPLRGNRRSFTWVAA